MPRKDLGCVQSVPLLLEEGDRVKGLLIYFPAKDNDGEFIP
jgi:hypothetical protein